MLGFFCGDIVGLEGASGLPSSGTSSSCASSRGDSDSPADEPPTPVAGEGAEAGADYPAPSEGTVPRPAAS